LPAQETIYTIEMTAFRQQDTTLIIPFRGQLGEVQAAQVLRFQNVMRLPSSVVLALRPEFTKRFVRADKLAASR
jgi:hypothetical protein